MDAKTFGYFGEKIAKDFFLRKGYLILKKNFTVRGGEIDLIAKKHDLIVFVEVKIRNQYDFGSGAESIHFFKRRSLKHAINTYLLRFHGSRDPPYRVDIVDIIYDKNNRRVKIEHFEDVEI